MKHAKKLASLLLALVMVLAMSTTAFAANVTLPQGDLLKDHTFVAYQIFTGNEVNGVLSDVEWGNGINSENFLAALKADPTYSSFFSDNAATTDVDEECKTADDVANVLGENNTNTGLANAVARIAFKYTTGDGISLSGGENALVDGYYLIVDTTDVSGDKDAVKNTALLQVVGDITIAVKTDKPTLDKQIKHNDDGSWGVVGDNQIGDTVEFRTITTVPDTTHYTNYTYTITDTMSAGLTSNVKGKSDIEIKVNDENNTGTVLDKKYYSVEIDNSNSNTFNLTIDILEAVKDGAMKANDKLYTYYSGVLNEAAKIYNESNQTNTAYLTYSNEPNGTGTGKTEEKIVYDWTFKMGVNKVKKDGSALEGAKFVLSKKGALDIKNLNLDNEGIPAATDDLIALIDNSDGTYTVAPTGYEGTSTYVINAGNVTIKGLDDATDYYLYETKAPAGYNLLTSPVKFKITAAYNTDGSALAENNPTVVVGTGEASSTLSTDVVNQAGSTLPETGGMGTTLFYIIGGLMVVGAAVLLIVKKRMSDEK